MRTSTWLASFLFLVGCGDTSGDAATTTAATTTAATTTAAGGQGPGGAGGAATSSASTGSGGTSAGGAGGASSGGAGGTSTAAGGAGGASAGGAGGAGGDPCAGETLERHVITPDELEVMMSQKDFELINVHIPYEGEIVGTDASIPYTDVPAIEDFLGHERGAKAVLYCLGGSMSVTAGDALVALGYCRIYDLSGGMMAWKAAGYLTK